MYGKENEETTSFIRSIERRVENTSVDVDLDLHLISSSRLRQMLFQPIQLFAFCLLFGLTSTTILCRTPSDKSHVDFAEKFHTSSIVAFGKVIEVNETSVMFKVKCSLKGYVINDSMEFIQPHQVANINQCHYLTSNKTYLVFLDSMTTLDPDTTTIYRLDDKEEIEIEKNLTKKSLDEQCQRKDHYGNTLTIFYADQTNRCKRLTMTCNEKTIESIGNFYQNPLTRTSTFLGLIQGIHQINNSQDTMINRISGKTGSTIGDESMRNQADRVMTMISLVFVLSFFTLYSKF